MNDSRTRHVTVARRDRRARPPGRALTGGSPVPGSGGAPPAVVVRHGPGVLRAGAVRRGEARRRRDRGERGPRSARTRSLRAIVFAAAGRSASRPCAPATRPCAVWFGATASVSSVGGAPPSAAVTRGLEPSSSRGDAERDRAALGAGSCSAPAVRSAFASPAASGSATVPAAARRLAGRAHASRRARRARGRRSRSASASASRSSRRRRARARAARTPAAASAPARLMRVGTAIVNEPHAAPARVGRRRRSASRGRRRSSPARGPSASTPPAVTGVMPRQVEREHRLRRVRRRRGRADARAHVARLGARRRRRRRRSGRRRRSRSAARRSTPRCRARASCT